MLEESQLPDDWPRVFATKFDAIPEGTIENNNPGWWQEGYYATVNTVIGDQNFEIELVLHNPKQEDQQLYMQFIQIIDDVNTTPDQNFYESFICTLKVNAISLEDGPRYYREIFGYGYRGKSELNEAIGQHGSLNVNEHESFQPWRLDLRRGNITQNEETGTFYERCTFKRNFNSPHSFLQLKEGMTLKVMTGYKFYFSSTWTTPNNKGYSGETPMEWTILEGATASLTTGAVALAAMVLSL